jgi:hypothetical protein
MASVMVERQCALMMGIVTEVPLRIVYGTRSMLQVR